MSETDGSKASMLERYEASMVLHGVSDAMGYKNGEWEFNFSGVDIHEQLKKLGGLENIKINKNQWRVSDDTVLHLANAENLSKYCNDPLSPRFYLNLVEYYKKAMHNMKDRAPGNTCIKTVSMLSHFKPDGYRIPFNPKGAGCGASMRSPCIGLRYSKPKEIKDLIAFSTESGRMTHHHPLGYLGGTAAALFTHYAIQDCPVKSWGARFLIDAQMAEMYIREQKHFVKENLDEWNKFITPWRNYLIVRDLTNVTNEPQFPSNYGVKERDLFYKTISGFEKNWAGALGLDSVLIAYDALLGCGGSWNELCLRAMLHGGDNDSTGSLAGSWYGALYGFKKVPENHYKELEYLDDLKRLGQNFYNLSLQEN